MQNGCLSPTGIILDTELQVIFCSRWKEMWLWLCSMHRNYFSSAESEFCTKCLQSWEQTTFVFIMCIGRFSEAGLLEWMCFVIFCARCCSALLGRFLSKCWFTLFITVEVKPRIAKQYKCQYCCSCKIYCGKGMEGGKKVFFVVFWLTRKSRVCRKNAFWSILYHEQQIIARHIMTMGLQKCL